MKHYTNNEIYEILYNDMDLLCIVSAQEDSYKALKCSENFADLIQPEGSYKELIEKLIFHMSDTNAKIADDYHVFLPKMGQFKRKVVQKLTLNIKGVKHYVVMIVLPGETENDDYVFILYELDQSEFERYAISENKVKTIQETYLFSMYVDLKRDQVSSITVTEISNDDMHYDVKYSEWRMMIVHMIWPEDQAKFLEITDPEYLKVNLLPGKSIFYNCQMKNLEGQYIWVKLIFGRTEVIGEQEFGFVFMVQDIDDTSKQLFSELKKFENLALHDALTGVFNHGRIEVELNNAIHEFRESQNQVSLMMLDIDYFKQVNDTYGHSVGDEILKAFVNAVEEKLQAYNIRIGRWGGEEFVCVCYGLDVESLCVLAEEIRGWIAGKKLAQIHSLTCSIGITGLYDDDTSKEAFARLDAALYEAKSSGRNCVRIRIK